MPIRLDKRLTLISSLVEGDSVADVGCDHGKLGYYLIGTDRAKLVIATDISAPSLNKATELAKDNGVEDVLITRLGDGLKPVKSGEVHTVIIAGLGGDVISDILEDARVDGKRFESFILSPNTHPEKVRRQIVKSGHSIIYDDTLECAGKVYTVIKTREGESTLTQDEIKFGKFYKTSDIFYKQTLKDIAVLERLIEMHPQSDSLVEKLNDLRRAISDR